VAAQPSGQVRAVPAVEDLDRAVGGHIDQHGAVMAPFPEREVVELLRRRSKSIYPEPGIIPGGRASWSGPRW
jgi:hypothetical protein